MRRALALAEQGRGRVEPNPLVGAVVVHAGQIVGEGWHQQFGGPHAEVEALRAAGSRAAGGELYVTLEPCCHHGKTPPCTDLIIQSGIQHVWLAMLDPFPQVAGRGVQQLQAAGIATQVGMEASAARELNAPYLWRLATGRPFVHAKWAMTLDGKIATATGESKWITGETARAHAHRFRGLVDGILVGVGTVLADDPLLTARPAGPRTPTRIVLDSAGRMPAGCRLVRTAGDVATLLAVTAHATPRFIEERSAAGCEVLVLPTDPAGRVNVGALLDELGRRGFTNLLVEGGPAVHGTFLMEEMINEARVYLAPILLGGDGKGPVGGAGFDRLHQAGQCRIISMDRLGDDWFFAGRVMRPAAADVE